VCELFIAGSCVTGEWQIIALPITLRFVECSPKILIDLRLAGIAHMSFPEDLGQLNLWPRSASFLFKNEELSYYDVFLSFSGRGTMKGVANAIEETIYTHYQTAKSSAPSVFNEDITQNIEDTVAKAIHSTHSGVAVLLINKRYLTRRWPIAEARVLAAMCLSGRIILMPVVVQETYEPAEAKRLWTRFVEVLRLTPDLSERLENHKYFVLVAPHCNDDAEQETIPVESLNVQDGYVELKDQLLATLKKKKGPILGSSRQDSFYSHHSN